MKQYYKNFILVGDIDYACLLCDEVFDCIENVEKHIRWERHRNRLKQQSYFPKLQKHKVSKVNQYYYCEVCNYTTESITTITEHVKLNEHATKKQTGLADINKNAVCKYEDDSVIFENGFSISKEAWHGVKEKKCSLCNTSTDCGRLLFIHTKKLSHALKVIQGETKQIGDNYYRQINNDTLYCFTCQENFSLEHLYSHWASEKHLKIKNEDKAKPVKDYQKPIHEDKFEINLAKYEAKCKICSGKVQLKGMVDHEKIHILNNELDKVVSDIHPATQTYFYDHGKRRAELAKYGRDNFIQMNEGGGRGYCYLCNILLSAHINIFRSHVNGRNHAAHLQLKGLLKTEKSPKPNFPMKPVKDFVKSIWLSEEFNLFCVNEAIAVKFLSYMLVSEIKDKKFAKAHFKCFACDEVLTKENLGAHIKSEEHKKNMNSAKVLIMPDEFDFVRVIKPGLYHCSYCNQVFPRWDMMKKHMEALQHRYIKCTHYSVDHYEDEDSYSVDLNGDEDSDLFDDTDSD